MPVPTTPRCRTVRSWVSAAHDDELSVERQVAMNSHLASCAACRRAQNDLAVLGVALRSGAEEHQPDDAAFAGLAAEVLARTAFEQDASWRRRVREMVEEGPGLWIIGGALAATMAVTVLIATVLSLATPVHPRSLAGLLQTSVALGSLGSNTNPISSRKASPGRGRRRAASRTRPVAAPRVGRHSGSRDADPAVGLRSCSRTWR